MSVRCGSTHGSESESGSLSPTSDHPSSSYDGSHLQWRTFRTEVLTPHRIRILDTVAKERIPASFLTTVEALSQNLDRFEGQKNSFWNQVTTGQGFGPSPLFPPNLLPPIEHETRLARCMVPSFSRDALPERVVHQMGPLYELSLPHPGLGCGFSAAAFTTRELATLPQWLHAGGTFVNFDTGYISPGSAMYCPFLTFERAFGNREHRVESANNQCAIGGAFTARALQMLYAKAWKGHMMPEFPISFSCTIDNTFALLNLHWIDQGQTYCMAPLCQFDLTKDVHFSKFLVWTQAIGDWAVSHVLPLVKEALNRLQTSELVPRGPNQPRTRLRLDTTMNHNELLLSGLKMTFENIPWRYEDEEFTPVSSSTASWGSPIVTEQTFANLKYPTVPAPRSTAPASAAALARRRMAAVERSPIVPPSQSQSQSTDLMWQKRLAYAMDEIRELQNQVLALKTDLSEAQSSIRNELSERKASPIQSEPATPKAGPIRETSRAPTPLVHPVISKPSVEKTKDNVTSLLSGYLLSSFFHHANFGLFASGCMARSNDWTSTGVITLFRLQLPLFWRSR